MKKVFIMTACVAVMGLLCGGITHSAEAPKFKPKEVKLDRNYDGIVDRTEFYSAEGIIQKVENDSSGDGKIDEWIYYQTGKPARSEKDTKGTGKPDTFLTYDAAGTVVKSEVDADGDSKTDEWVYYEAGKPVKAEKDTNKDGKADTFLSY